MKIKYLSTLLFGLFTSLTVSAQQLKEFTLEDLNFGGTNYHNMVPKNRYCTWWGDQLVHLDGDACYIVNKATGKETKLFGKDELNKWIAPTRDIKVHSLLGAKFPYADKSVVVVNNGATIYTVDFKKHKLISDTEIVDGYELLETNYKGGTMALLKDNNLFVRRGDKEWQLSNDGSREIVYGQSVHRDEFGIHKGTYFSNDGSKIAFYRMDQSMVTDYPQVDIPEIDYFNHPETQTCCAKAAPDKYPMTGETSHKVMVGVFDTTTGKTLAIQPTDILQILLGVQMTRLYICSSLIATRTIAVLLVTMQQQVKRMANFTARPMPSMLSHSILSCSCLGITASLLCRVRRTDTTIFISALSASMVVVWHIIQSRWKSSNLLQANG